MARITKLELQQALNERNAQLEAARLRIAELEGDVAALKRQLSEAKPAAPAAPAAQPARKEPNTGPRRVFEFDPAVPGDFRRAMNAARECGGLVRRASMH